MSNDFRVSPLSIQNTRGQCGHAKSKNTNCWWGLQTCHQTGRVKRDSVSWRQFCTINCFQVKLSLYATPYNKEIQDSIDSGFLAVNSTFEVLDSSFRQRNLDSGFQWLVGFPHSLICIPDSKAQHSWFSRIQKSGFPYMERYIALPTNAWQTPNNYAWEAILAYISMAVALRTLGTRIF